MGAKNEGFKFFDAGTADPIGKYTQPKDYSAPTPNTGYPNGVTNTQTVLKRGAGAATKGNKCSTKLA